MLRRPVPWLTPVLTAAVLSGCGPADRSPDTEADRRAVRAVFADLERANNSGDVEAWVSLFADGAVYMPSRSPTVDTRQGLREIARRGFSVHRTDVDIEPVEVTVAGDWAFARAAVTGTVTVSEGEEPIEIDNRELAVLRRDASGGWKLARLMINRNG